MPTPNTLHSQSNPKSGVDPGNEVGTQSNCNPIGLNRTQSNEFDSVRLSSISTERSIDNMSGPSSSPNYASDTRQGILTKIRKCEQLQKILRARASLAYESSRPSSFPARVEAPLGPGAKKDGCFRRLEQASTRLIFASNLRQGQILRALSN